MKRLMFLLLLIKSFVFYSQDIAGNLSAETQMTIERVAGPEIQIVYPTHGEVVATSTFAMEVDVDALDSQIAVVEYCVGDTLTTCFTADCAGESDESDDESDDHLLGGGFRLRSYGDLSCWNFSGDGESLF